MLIDTHCHLTHGQYEEDVGGVLTRARLARVGAIVSIASDLDDAERVAELIAASERPAGTPGALVPGRPAPPQGLPRLPELPREPSPLPMLFGTAGIHPHEAASAPPDLPSRLKETLDGHPRVIAVGECGLDYHYDHSPREVQRRVFEAHVEVAAERDLPMVVHCRDAEDDMIPLVREAGRAGVSGVLHCFPGHLGLFEAAMASDWMVSFTGIVTFRNFDGDEAVRRVPADRYMLETDGPYMAPVPHRGRRNEPAFLPHIATKAAELRDESLESVASRSTENAVRFFRLPPLD